MRVSGIRLGVVSVQVGHQNISIILARGAHETRSPADLLRDVGVDKSDCTIAHPLVPQVQVVAWSQWLKLRSHNRPHRVLAEEQAHGGQPGIPVVVSSERGHFDGDEVFVVSGVHEEPHILRGPGLFGYVFDQRGHRGDIIVAVGDDAVWEDEALQVGGGEWGRDGVARSLNPWIGLGDVLHLDLGRGRLCIYVRGEKDPFPSSVLRREGGTVGVIWTRKQGHVVLSTGKLVRGKAETIGKLTLCALGISVGRLIGRGSGRLYVVVRGKIIPVPASISGNKDRVAGGIGSGSVT